MANLWRRGRSTTPRVGLIRRPQRVADQIADDFFEAGAAPATNNAAISCAQAAQGTLTAVSQSQNLTASTAQAAQETAAAVEQSVAMSAATMQAAQSGEASATQVDHGALATAAPTQDTSAAVVQHGHAIAENAQGQQATALVTLQQAAGSIATTQPTQEADAATTQHDDAVLVTTQAAQRTAATSGDLPAANAGSIESGQQAQQSSIAVREPGRSKYAHLFTVETVPGTNTGRVRTGQASQGTDARAESVRDERPAPIAMAPTPAITAMGEGEQAAQGGNATATQTFAAVMDGTQTAQGTLAQMRGDKRIRLAQLMEHDPDAAVAQMLRWQRDAA